MDTGLEPEAGGGVVRESQRVQALDAGREG